MISLRRILTEQKLLFLDLGDRKPVKDVGESVPNDPVLDLPLRKKLETCLQSDNQSHILWACSKLPQLIKLYPDLVELLPFVFNLFKKNSQFIEYAAFCCCYNIAKDKNTYCFTKILIAIMERMLEFPAIEYVEIVKLIIPGIPSSAITELIINPALEMLLLSDQVQHAASQILISLDYKEVGLPSDLFDKCLKSPIMCINYLPQLAHCIERVKGREWAVSELPMQLLTIANSFESLRGGLVRTVLSFVSTDVMEKSIYQFTLNAINWSASDLNLVFPLLEYSDALLAQKGSDFIIRLKELVQKVPQVPDRSSFPGILVKIPILFQVADAQCRKALRSFRDTLKNKTAFLQNAVSLFQIASQQSKEIIAAEIQNLILDQEVMEVAIPVSMSPAFGASVLVAHANATSKALCSLPRFKYRAARAWLTSFVGIPAEFTSRIWCVVFPAVLEFVEYNPHALAPSFTAFVHVVSRTERSNDRLSLLVDGIVRLSRSKSVGPRCLFARAAMTMMYGVPHEIIVDRIFPALLPLAHSDSPPVVTAAGAAMKAFQAYFRKQGEPILEQQAACFAEGFGKQIRPPLVAFGSGIASTTVCLLPLDGGIHSRSEQALVKTRRKDSSTLLVQPKVSVKVARRVSLKAKLPRIL